MAKFPVSGVPSLASDSTSKFIPAIWSTKLVTKFYDSTVFTEIANTDYEGEIKAHGDEVIIRTVPSITINNYQKGGGLNYEDPESPNVTLTIDQGKYFAFNCWDIDKHQSDIDLMNKWSEDASEQMKIAIDTDILAAIGASAHADNSGDSAGRISGDIDLGEAAAGVGTNAVQLTKANILDHLVDWGTVLDEQSVPESNRWVVLPAKACGLIKKSDLRDASIAGDGTSILRNGRLGMIDRFTIYRSNNLNVNNTEIDILFGHPSALTFAAQITEMETIKNPDDFGDLVRGLEVYGFEVIKPEALGHVVAKY
ncbi:MAG: hypothetical protein CME59_22625 [Halioglobus sp.]|nr:hypothetical protein [Halioglobus sp.]|tara:strand:- start:217 stop:1149 length:933 start_codon:yes stop_codon:yes gene_type:complete